MPSNSVVLQRGVISAFFLAVGIAVASARKKPLLESWPWIDNPIGGLIGAGVPIVLLLSCSALLTRLRPSWIEEVNDQLSSRKTTAVRFLSIGTAAAAAWLVFYVALVGSPVSATAIGPGSTGEWSLIVLGICVAAFGLAFGQSLFNFRLNRVIARVSSRDPDTPGLRRFKGEVLPANNDGVVVPYVGRRAAAWDAKVWTKQQDNPTPFEQDAAPFAVAIKRHRIYVKVDEFTIITEPETGKERVKKTLPHDWLVRMKAAGVTAFQIGVLRFNERVDVTGYVERDATGKLWLRGVPTAAEHATTGNPKPAKYSLAPTIRYLR